MGPDHFATEIHGINPPVVRAKIDDAIFANSRGRNNGAARLVPLDNATIDRIQLVEFLAPAPDDDSAGRPDCSRRVDRAVQEGSPFQFPGPAVQAVHVVVLGADEDGVVMPHDGEAVILPAVLYAHFFSPVSASSE